MRAAGLCALPMQKVDALRNPSLQQATAERPALFRSAPTFSVWRPDQSSLSWFEGVSNLYRAATVRQVIAQLSYGFTASWLFFMPHCSKRSMRCIICLRPAKLARTALLLSPIKAVGGILKCVATSRYSFDRALPKIPTSSVCHSISRKAETVRHFDTRNIQRSRWRSHCCTPIGQYDASQSHLS